MIQVIQVIAVGAQVIVFHVGSHRSFRCTQTCGRGLARECDLTETSVLELLALSRASPLPHVDLIQSRGISMVHKKREATGFPFFNSRLNQMTWTIASVTTSMLLWFSAATQMRPVSRA
ncbi:hypothetical protein D3C75_1185440 [compost metagenome]